MALKIETFSNVAGGNAFYKAIAHPLAAAPARELCARLRAGGPVAVYDPHGYAAAFNELYPLEGVRIDAVFVQAVEHLGREFRGVRARPVSDLGAEPCRSVFIADFDTRLLEERLCRLFPSEAKVESLDALRIPANMQTNKGRYLSNMNFATNFAFFRDASGLHTRLVTANYWGNYGSPEGFIWFALFGEDGRELATWQETLPQAGATIVVDSAAVRERFALPEFTGQLFLHVVGAAGHDVVKYALDTYGDPTDVLSCTHDANSWPSNLYAGLPAPDTGEEVVLWVQNSHPIEIGEGEIGLNLMGHSRVAYLSKAIAPFASYRLSTADLLPEARWPQQIEIRAGKHVVRPRYEVVRADGRRRIAHPNVEREDLTLDDKLPGLVALVGKGFILPAPILPPERYSSYVLPTPMSTAQSHLPLKVLLHDSSGRKVAEHSFGNLARGDSVVLDLGEALGNRTLEGGYGHLELVYDFDAGLQADGWMHALFRYVDRKSGHRAETSFGAHMFNMLTTYKTEPQSYNGPPPGLRTRLFLRLGPLRYETMCHLIYPASRPWHAFSDTQLILMSDTGEEVARRAVKIPCNGSLLWRANDMFDAEERRRAGTNGHVIVRDATCRLFGYHGLLDGESAFSLDHMFGF